MKKQEYILPIGSSQILIELNDWMAQTNSSLIASIGETKIMVAIVLGPESNKEYLPLKVEYQERYYARGEILGGQYNKREGKPSDEAVVTARMIDRAVRPFFPKDFTREVLVVVTVLSLGEYDPDIIALNATALALEHSSIPWNGPVVSARFLKDSQGSLLINPTYQERSTQGSEGVVAIHGDRICMLEVESNELPESELADLVLNTKKYLVEATEQYKIIRDSKRREKLVITDSYLQEIKDLAYDFLHTEIVTTFEHIFNDDYQKTLHKKCKEFLLKKQENLTDLDIQRVFDQVFSSIIRNEMLQGRRVDGRDSTSIRELFADIEVLPKQVHGSSLFYRGETHVLAALTVGYVDDALALNEMEIQEQKQFFLHYNFPSYSVGEVGKVGPPGRREIGHGMLAEKAFRRIIPSPKDFPYTVRVVCEVLASNGSTSMASVCASSLALFDAGIPLARHVAGIAIGLIEGDDGTYILLTDITGKEDHFGDMDFKIAGTELGVTAVQLDCKNGGLTDQMFTEALTRSKNARNELLTVLSDRIASPKALTGKIQKIETIKIESSKIGLVIGKGGSTIKEITRLSGAKIDIKHDGTVLITGSESAITVAKEKIQMIAR